MKPGGVEVLKPRLHLVTIADVDHALAHIGS
jgi:hypothetical protein